MTMIEDHSAPLVEALKLVDDIADLAPAQRQRSYDEAVALSVAILPPYARLLPVLDAARTHIAERNFAHSAMAADSLSRIAGFIGPNLSASPQIDALGFLMQPVLTEPAPHAAAKNALHSLSGLRLVPTSPHAPQ